MASKKTSHSDVTIIGAGPAGSTAALLLARAGYRTTLLDAAKFPRRKPCAGWLNSRATETFDALGLKIKDFILGKITEVSFLNGDLTKQATPKLEGSAGLIVDRTAFDEKLVRAACSEGAVFADQHLVSKINPLEDGVELILRDHEPLTAELLIIATGMGASLLSQVGVLLPPSGEPRWSIQIEQNKSPKKKGKAVPTRATVVFGATPEGGFCLALESPDRISLTLNSTGDEAMLTARLGELARSLATGGHVSIDLSDLVSEALRVPTFSHSALDLDSHVGKHTLVIGDAGGFVATTSHEGIFPAMWSAQIAARVLETSRTATFTQDALITFDTEWRLELGEFLRPPNTDLQLLTPLVFSNQPMANRMAAAFFGGQNI